MHQALNLARRGLGFTAPNPVVGAVIVRDGRVLGKGFHRKAGTEHAEVLALRAAGAKAENATLFVTLEPCAHFGKTPPCTKQIIAAKIKRVVAAMTDPNPLVDGKGIAELRANGIAVDVGLMEKRARRLNEVFITAVTKGRPFVALKAASSLDGRIAVKPASTGDGGMKEPRWITNEKSREYGRRLRGIYDAVMVGINTVLEDDPDLTPRLTEFKSKKTVRIVCDSRAQTPLESRLVKTAGENPVIVAVTKNALPANVKKLTKAGVTVLLVAEDRGRLDLDDLLEKLFRIGITSVFVEGGGTLHASFVEQSLFDKLYLFFAPLVFGGANPYSFVRGRGIMRIEDAPRLVRRSIRFFDDDMLFEFYPEGSLFAEAD